jgi:hypothetical protein
LSLLAMWHPAGPGASTLHVGEPDAAPGAVCDVAVVAPAPGAGADGLRGAIGEAAERLAPGGIAWLIVERSARGGAERAARRAGLVVVDRVLMVPGWPATEHFVSLAPAALADAAVRRFGLAPRSAQVPALLCRTTATRALLARVARHCAIVVARPGEAAPLRWLGEIDGAGARAATVAAGSRHDAPVATVLRFASRSRQPDLAVKVALDERGAARLRAERAALGSLGAAAAAAGAAVPQLRPATDRALLAAGALAGRPAAALLARSPERLDDVLRAVGDWLLAWNRATAATAPATAAVLERRLLRPAARVAAAKPATAPYAEAMRRLAARLNGAPLVSVPVHDDLTMSNVLLDGGRLGIVDWEAASPEGLPLLDLWYALADALARSRRVGHVRALEMLTTEGGPDAPPAALAALPAAHAAALGLSADQALLGFHACWLGHAADELSRGAPGPFVEIVEMLAVKEAARR